MGSDMDKAAALLEEGKVKAIAGKAEESIPLLRRAVKLNPESIEAKLMLGMVYTELGRAKEAMKVLDVVVSAQPDNPLALSALAGAHLMLGNLAEGIGNLERAIEHAPEEPELMCSLAHTYLLTGSPDRARDMARRAIAIDPDVMRGHLILGQAYHALGQTKRAIKALRKAAEIDAQSPDPHYELGRVFVDSTQWKNAIPSLERAVEIDDQHAAAHAFLGAARAWIGDETQAIGSIEKALQLDSENALILFMVGQTYFVMERAEDAIAIYRRMIAQDPEDPVPYLCLGKVAAAVGDYDTFTDACMNLIRLDPDMAQELSPEIGNILPYMAGSRRAPAGAGRAPRRAERAVYQLKVTLKDIRPPIWRRLLVPSDTKLSKLHHVLQIAMGWTDSHLHLFRAGGMDYSAPEFELDDAVNEKRVTLEEVVIGEKSKFIYEYDFGDSWEHEILVEKVLPVEKDARYPICIAGKRNGPPEDCGGPWGYPTFLEAIRDPKHPDHEDMLEWIGGEFDPEAFDLDEVNKRLARIR